MKRFYKVTVYNIICCERLDGSVYRRWGYFDTYYFTNRKDAIISFNCFNNYNKYFKAVLRMVKKGGKHGKR